ncbi:N-acetyltransferase [Mesobacillus jeotgali]|uniref:N-acetyltransferase n=1 Tax=Mesobacillus jeotgali TaxID=129985 RepID=UPI0009A8F72C|nr:N-acetyltransferase [Mesobacillus jeotgali]
MEILYQGILKNDSGTEETFTVRELTLEDLDGILEVQNIIISSLTDRNALQPLTEEEYRHILQGNGIMAGAFIDDRLIAFRALLVPMVDEDHLGRDIGLGEEELAQVIYQEISNVIPKYRGNKLQQTLAILLMQELSKQEHQYRYVCCTVAPFNIPSLKDKFAQGLEIAALKEKYGGMLRYVFVKDLSMPGDRDWNEVLTIPMEDTVSQQEAISGGYRGFDMAEESGVWQVLYGK